MKKKQYSTPHPHDVYIGAKIRLQREAAGVTQQKLADALGITFQQVQKYENAKNRVCARYLNDIANHLKVEVSYFYEGIQPDKKDDDFIIPEIKPQEIKLVRCIRKLRDGGNPDAFKQVEALITMLSEQPAEN